MTATAATARTCEVCSAPIDHLRADARVCSATCRGRKSRGDPYLPPGDCSECGTTLPGGRADRLTCSPRCRAARWRRLALEARIGVAPGCRCGGATTDVDEDGDRVCVSCGRPA